MEELLKENPLINNLRVSDLLALFTTASITAQKRIQEDPYPDNEKPKNNREIAKCFGVSPSSVAKWHKRKIEPLKRHITWGAVSIWFTDKRHIRQS